MPKRLHLLTLLISAALTALAPSMHHVSFNIHHSFPPTGQDYALFFAVENYAGRRLNDLNNPIDDANKLAGELKKNYGFKTEVVPDPNYATIKKKLAEYKAKFADGSADANGQLLIFFSGHGERQYGNGFFLPADADPENLEQSAFSYSYWRNAINEIPCRHLLVALDACYSGTFDPHWDGRPGGLYGQRGGELGPRDKLLEQHRKAQSRKFFCSGAVDKTTPDQSDFAKKFLEGLLSRGGGDGILTSSELYGYLSNATPAPRGGEFGNDEAGSSFLFVASAVPADPGIAQDRASWLEADQVKTLVAYRNYKAQHPSGDFIELAEERIAVLDDEAAWLRAKAAGTPEEYTDFAARFPASPYAAVAQKRAAAPDLANPPTVPGDIPGFMARITGGTFQMGDLFGEGESDEKPTHSVTLKDFLLSRYELTVGEFRAFVEADAYKTDAEKGDGSYVVENPSWTKKAGVNWRHDEQGNLRAADNLPVIHISWNDAVAYCNWRSKKEKMNPVYTTNGSSITCNWAANGYRLPTEAEWEYAARESGRKLRFGNGKDIADPKEINFNGSASYKKDYSLAGEYREKTVAVGSFAANASGLYDMSGNVFEWCWDWYGSDYYGKSGNGSNPHGPDTGSYRVLRGGSWSNVP